MKNLIPLGNINIGDVQPVIKAKELVLYRVDSLEHRYHGTYYTLESVIYEALCVESKLFPVPYVIQKKELRKGLANSTVYEIGGHKDFASTVLKRHSGFIVEKFRDIPNENKNFVKLWKKDAF